MNNVNEMKKLHKLMTDKRELFTSHKNNKKKKISVKRRLQLCEAF